jgi:mannose-6-phosphate isomerase-like protein (cupin superfamily)
MSQRPSVEVFMPRDLGPRDWGREILVCQTEHFIGKILLMKAGKAGGLQYHQRKIESFFLDEGQAFVDYDAGDTASGHGVDGLQVHRMVYAGLQ